jgi:MoaA/NifB/PqqE/SkfB family radical SAM enzyme
MKDVLQKTKEYVDRLYLSIENQTILVSPISASLHATKRCNSKCIYCGIWKNRQFDPPIEDLLLAVNELSEIGVMFISLTGGEPFLNNNLPMVIKQINNHKILSSVMTNGALLKNKYVEPIFNAGLNSLCVSLDTTDEETYQMIRGVPISPVIDGLRYLSKIRKSYPALVVFSINCVISKVNLDQLEDLILFCNDLDISVGFQPLHRSFESRYNPKNLQFEESDLPHLYEVVEGLIKMKNDGYRIDNSEDYLRGFPEFLVYKQLPPGTKCTAGFTSISIDADLNVRGCWPKEVVGNLKHNKLKEIWKSELYNKIRLSMLNLDCPKCWLRCHTDYLSIDWLMEKLNRVRKINKELTRSLKEEIHKSNE